MLAAGDTAPDFRLNDLQRLSFALSDVLKDGPALVAFFKISCPVCQLTMPYLDRLTKSTMVRVLGISQDDERATAEFRREFGITYPTLIDPASRGYPVSSQYELTNVPSLFLVQPDGEIAASWSGWSKRDMEALAGIAGVPLFEPGESIPEWKAG